MPSEHHGGSAIDRARDAIERVTREEWAAAQRFADRAILHACESCGAQPNEPCTGGFVAEIGLVHPARMKAEMEHMADILRRGHA